MTCGLHSIVCKSQSSECDFAYEMCILVHRSATFLFINLHLTRDGLSAGSELARESLTAALDTATIEYDESGRAVVRLDTHEDYSDADADELRRGTSNDELRGH